ITAGPTSAAWATETFLPLRFEVREDAKNTLHRFVQVVGKIRLASAPVEHFSTDTTDVSYDKEYVNRYW
ncbi:MAG: hypothetical protein JOZ19_03075, partial [Rubrobacter sp.]|nr:hypothetical protein [Rubrobacter sp.]